MALTWILDHEVIQCGLTTMEAPLSRLPVKPSDANGLRVPCCLMVDKIVTVPRAKVCGRVGRLDDEGVVRADPRCCYSLGLARRHHQT
jgi:mRNA interferase MazF